MPKNLFQDIVFTLIMVVVMVYAMVCYNIALDFGELNNTVFVAAFSELWYMGLIAFGFEILVVGPIAKKLAFRILNPEKTQPILLTLAISGITVCFMCPIMSLMATLIIKQPAAPDFFAVWVQTSAFNFPMALCWQIFFAGPLVRLIFRTIFTYIPSAVKRRKARGVQSEVACTTAGTEVAEKKVSSVTDSAPSQNSEENKS